MRRSFTLAPLPGVLCLLILATGTASAQLRSLNLSFTGIECASCLESLPARIERLHGVESVKVDAARQTVAVRFAAQNRIRLEQIRDAIEQDGTKTREAAVNLKGTLSQEGGTWQVLLPNGSRFELALGGASPSVQYSLKAGVVSMTGTVKDLHPPSSRPLALTPSEIEPVNE